MNYNNYVQSLKNKNILLFDHQYRLSYYKLNKIITFNNQTGGGNYNTNPKLFKNKSNEDLCNIINLSLSNNIKLGYLYYLIYN
uniref:Uncharacterized protein n=1 Tax=viral metagenome TaxID=1070528 RepID=A0A6C0J5H7_9ZZZZ